MKVRELIEALKRQDPNADVMMSYVANDHWGTERADDIGYVERTTLVKGSSGWELDDTGENESSDERDAVVLR